LHDVLQEGIMAVDERSRHQLYSRLEEVLGAEAATTLIEHLPPVGWADVATRHDLAGLEERMDLRFARVDDRFESWFGTHDLSSLRFVQNQQEGRKDRERNYEIFPERAAFREGDDEEERSVANPLDDGSFIYYVRTLPLRPGDVYEVNRYFRPDRNPVRIRVLRRERVSVPAGTFDAVVVQPSIKTKGIFSEGGHAEIWFSDDADRVMLQLKSQLSFGSLNLYLKSKQDGRKLGS